MYRKCLECIVTELKIRLKLVDKHGENINAKVLTANADSMRAIGLSSNAIACASGPVYNQFRSITLTYSTSNSPNR